MTVQFDDGTVQQARVKFINPKAAPITYKGTFYLAEPGALTVPVNSPKEEQITIAGHSDGQLDYDVQMPLITQDHKDLVACVEVAVAGTVLATFVGGQAVRVNFAPSVEWGDIIWV